MNKLMIILTLFVSVKVSYCIGQTQGILDRKILDNYKTQVLPEDEMIKTTEKAIKLIQSKNYLEFKQLFAEDIAKNFSEQQFVQLVEQLNLLFQKEGVPTGSENILPAISASIRDGDTIFVNNIMYNYKPFTNGTKSFTRVLTFSFLKKYGTQKLASVNVRVNPFSTGTAMPTIKQIENFTFDVSEISRFRIYFDEGKSKTTKYKNETGYFAIEGDLTTLEKSGIKPIIQEIFSDLSKSKFESVKPFNASLDRGDNPKFIQAEFGFRDKPYSLFIYLPIQDGGKYSNKIILMQREYANLGFEFTLNQSDYQKITSVFPKIAELKLDNYYVDKP